MDADFSVEIGGDAPALEFPWTDPGGALAYVDLKHAPERVRELPEVAAYPELIPFLTALNAADSPLETAKCDVWSDDELDAEEIIYGSAKIASYLDVLFTDEAARANFALHELFVRSAVEHARSHPEFAAVMELVVRRCFFGADREGYYVTAYVSGFGDVQSAARANWARALGVAQETLLTAAKAALQ